MITDRGITTYSCAHATHTFRLVIRPHFIFNETTTKKKYIYKPEYEQCAIKMKNQRGQETSHNDYDAKNFVFFCEMYTYSSVRFCFHSLFVSKVSEMQNVFLIALLLLIFFLLLLSSTKGMRELGHFFRLFG